MRSIFLVGFLVFVLTVRNGFAERVIRFPNNGKRFPAGSRNGQNQLEDSPSVSELVLLPTSVIPMNYALELMPVLDEGVPNVPQFTAPGKVTITVTCMEVGDKITLHSSPILNITEGSVTVTDMASGDLVPVIGHEYNTTVDFYTIVLERDLVLDEVYEIYIEFLTPVARDVLDGLYLAQFTPPGSTTPSYMAVTQFAATYARQAFPCFDEPYLKASFDIKVGHHSDYIAVSNSPVFKSEEIPEMDGWVWTSFDTTQRMSPYLVAIIVANYTFAESEHKLQGDKPVRVYAPPHMIENNGGVYASDTSALVMTFYEEYFNMPFQMPKMDSAAIPAFTFGAMENWGLITYREGFLLHYEGVTTEAERARISSIISHESAHQWFGNVVTCKQWNSVWLNEGFATYWSYFGVNATHPEFEPFDDFLNNAFQLSMPFDADPDFTHPVLNDASTPEDIFIYFDEISYEKAGSLIRMMEGFLTMETLKAGLRNYLVKLSFLGAEQDDLFEVLTEQAHADGTLPADQTVKEIMDTWTLQTGFPLLKVSRVSSDRVFVTQERFSSHTKSYPSELDPNDLWHVPVAVVTQSDPTVSRIPKFWLAKNVLAKSYAHNTAEWIMLNPDATGYFRVLYDASLTWLIQKQLEMDHTVISVLSRSQLLDDYFNCAFRSGTVYTSVDDALRLTKYLGNETSYPVWNTVLTNFQVVYERLAGTSAFPAFTAYLIPKLESVLSHLGVVQPVGEKGTKVIFRARILEWACAMDAGSCVTYASEQMKALQDAPGTHTIPIDVQAVVYCFGVSQGNSETFDFIKDRYMTESSLIQKGLLLNALACTRNSSLLASLLDSSLEDEEDSGILNEHRRTLIQGVVANTIGRPLAISVLDRILAAFGESGPVTVKDIVSTLGVHSSTLEELANIQNFVNTNAVALESVLLELNESMDAIEENIEWIGSFYEPINNWLIGATNGKSNRLS